MAISIFFTYRSCCCLKRHNGGAAAQGPPREPTLLSTFLPASPSQHAPKRDCRADHRKSLSYHRLPRRAHPEQTLPSNPPRVRMHHHTGPKPIQCRPCMAWIPGPHGADVDKEEGHHYDELNRPTPLLRGQLGSRLSFHISCFLKHPDIDFLNSLHVMCLTPLTHYTDAINLHSSFFK